MISVVAGAVCIYLLWQQRRELLRIRAGLDYSDIDMSRKELQTEQLIELTTENKRLQMTANVLNDRIDSFQTMVENSYDNVHRQYTEILKAIDSLPPVEYSDEYANAGQDANNGNYKDSYNDSYKNEEFMFVKEGSVNSSLSRTSAVGDNRQYSLSSSMNVPDMKGISQISSLSDVSQKSGKKSETKSLYVSEELTPEPHYEKSVDSLSLKSSKSEKSAVSSNKSSSFANRENVPEQEQGDDSIHTPEVRSSNVSAQRKSLTLSLSGKNASQSPKPHTAKYADMKISELRQQCRQLNISSQGNKQELVERLVAHVSTNASN
jgi:hypothetical protein